MGAPSTKHEPSSLGTASDASGRPVAILDPGVDWLLGRYDRFDQETLDRIMVELGVEGRAARRLILGGTGFVALLVVAAAGAIAIDIAIEGPAAQQDLLGSLLFTGPAVAMMLAAGVVLPVIVARRRRLARSRDILLRHGHCPHCGYRIREVPPRPESGQTVCPECASAWRIL